MSKFGDIIDVEVPVLLEFFNDWDDKAPSMHAALRDVAATLGDKAKVIKIDVEKNTELAEALRIKTLPTLMVYKGGEMKWRQSGALDADVLIDVLQQYV
ncbi:MAG: thioredoxin family protein [Flavobacteriaceae bacterium]